MSKTLTNHGLINTAKVNVARGAGCESCYLCSFGKITGRIFLLELLGCSGNVREEKFRKKLVVHF
jgi:hypothetical protein